MQSIRDKILNAKDIKEDIMEIEEWDVTLLVRGMTGQQRADLLQSALDDDGKVNMASAYPIILVSSIYDPDTREHIFTKKDIALLNEKSGGVMERIAMRCMQLSGLSKEDVSTARKN